MGKIVKMHFLLQKHFLCPNCILSPKYIFGTQSDFWAKSAIWSKKSPLELSRTHIPPALFASGRGRTPKRWIFAPKSTFWLQNAFWAQKCIFGAKVQFLRKNALLRPHAADAYKTNGILIKMESLLAQKRFWAEKCILGSKIDFGARNAKSYPKMHFWAKKCYFRKSDQKVNVRLDLTEGEQGIPDSGPDSIHGRPGLLKHVAFSVPLHSNYILIIYYIIMDH